MTPRWRRGSPRRRSSRFPDPGANAISYDYEPDPAIPEFSWDASATAASVASAAATAAKYGLVSLASPTGRPILEPALAGYGWQYSRLMAPLTGPGLIQTQTWVRQGRFRAALDVLTGQFGGPRFIPEISIASDVNGVSVADAIGATQLAQTRGIRAVFVWWNHASRLADYLSGT